MGMNSHLCAISIVAHLDETDEALRCVSAVGDVGHGGEIK